MLKIICSLVQTSQTSEPASPVVSSTLFMPPSLATRSATIEFTHQQIAFQIFTLVFWASGRGENEKDLLVGLLVFERGLITLLISQLLCSIRFS